MESKILNFMPFMKIYFQAYLILAYTFKRRDLVFSGFFPPINRKEVLLVEEVIVKSAQ